MKDLLNPFRMGLEWLITFWCIFTSLGCPNFFTGLEYHFLLQGLIEYHSAEYAESWLP